MHTSPTTAPPAIRVTDVGKTYRLWPSPGARLFYPLLVRLARSCRRLAPRLAQAIQDSAEQRLHTHIALQNITFELPHGRALGIVGLNGSGKSTLLQIIAGVMAPSTGQVEIRGRIAALLELGSGFNLELTGRENIRINAAILGLTRVEIDRVFDDIVEFADIGDYIDEPVKTYSSGMALRLAFAVQVHTEPDILIVDEALAVGDAAFQAKAMARIDEILARGTTLLFVGHDLNAVKAFCHEAMLLERGQIVLRGLPDEIITEYLYRTHRTALAERRKIAGSRVDRFDDGYGLEDARVIDGDINGARHATVGFNAKLEISLKVALRTDMSHPAIIVDIMDGKGLQLCGRRIPLSVALADGQQSNIMISLDAAFQQGVYRLRTRVVDAPSLSQTTVIARQEGALSFEVIDDSRALFTGLYPVPMDIRIER